MLKQVIVETKKGFKLFGKNIKPNEVNTFNIRQIFSLLGVGGGVKVFELLPDGTKIRLNKDNYDKVNHSSVTSVVNTEEYDKEPTNFSEGNPEQPDGSSNEDSGTILCAPPIQQLMSTQNESEIVEEPGTNEKNMEPTTEETSSEPTNKKSDVSSEVGTESPTEEPETVENEESVVVQEELVTNDTTGITTEGTEPVNVKANNGYNIPKKPNKYKK